MHRFNSRPLRILSSAGLGCALALIVTGANAFTPILAELESFRIGSYSLTAGGSASGVATVTSVGKGAGTPIVSFSSSNTSVATVPASKVVSSEGIATVPVSAISAGCARITASFGGRTRIDDIVVHSAPTASMSVTVPDRYLFVGPTVDGTINKRLTTTVAADGSLTLQRATFSLRSSNPAVAAVPATVLQTSNSTTFHIRGAGEGCAVITVTTGTQSVSKAVKVVLIPG
jgi:hypothetical protein